MAVIAAYTSPSIGHLYPLVGVLLELQSRGHRIHLRCQASEVDRMRGLGFEASAVDRRIEAIEFEDWRSRSMPEIYRSTTAVFVRRGALEGPDMRDLLDASRADAVITDANTWGASAVAERSGLPWAMLCSGLPVTRAPGHPPFGPGLLPPRTRLDRMLHALMDRGMLEAAIRWTMPRVNALRALVAGLSPVATWDEVLERPHRMLLTTAEPLEYRRTHPAHNLRSVGPIAWEPEQALPEWLQDDPSPLVLATTASDYQGDAEIARATMRALEPEQIRVVATMPSGARLGMEPGPRCRVERFVPHGPVLERAEAIVTHGGLGVAQKALLAGVPLVIVPWSRDQLEVAARVVHAGVGVRVRRSQLTPERIRDAIERARTMQPRVVEVAAQLRAAGGAARAATEVEAILHGHHWDAATPVL